MMRKRPRPKRTTVETKEPRVKLLEEWFNFVTWKKDFITNSKLDRICAKLVEWARTCDDAIKIQQFLCDEGIAYNTWTCWMERYEIVKEADRQARIYIGVRREKGIMTRKYEATWTAFMQPCYDPEWEAREKRREELKQKKEEDGGARWIVIEKAADSPLVPKKKDDE